MTGRMKLLISALMLMWTACMAFQAIVPLSNMESRTRAASILSTPKKKDCHSSTSFLLWMSNDGNVSSDGVVELAGEDESAAAAGECLPHMVSPTDLGSPARNSSPNL